MFLTHLIIATIGVIIALCFKGRFHKIIAFGVAICVALPFLGNRIVTTYSFLMFGVFALLTSLYGIQFPNLTKKERVAIILTGLVMAVSTFMKFQHLPGASVIRLMMIVPIVSLMAILLYRKRVTKEVSFMLYWAFYALTQIWHVVLQLTQG